MKSAVTLQYTYLVSCAQENSSAFSPLSQFSLSTRLPNHLNHRLFWRRSRGFLLLLLLLVLFNRNRVPTLWLAVEHPAHAWEEPVWGDEVAALRRCRHVVRLVLRASLVGGIRGIIITVRAVGTLGLLTFCELLMCLGEEEESTLLAVLLVVLEYIELELR